MAEIDDATLKVLQNAKGVLDKLNGDPESRALLEKGLKKHFPQVETEEDIGARLAAPHIEKFTKEVVEPLKAKLTSIEEADAKQAEKAAETSLTEAFGEMRTRGFTDEGIEAVKKMMVENSIADPRAAAARFLELNPPAPREEQSQFSPPAWNMDQNLVEHDVKGLFADPDNWGDKMATQVMNEIKVGRG